MIYHAQAKIPFVLSEVEARSHEGRKASFDFAQDERVGGSAVT